MHPSLATFQRARQHAGGFSGAVGGVTPLSTLSVTANTTNVNASIATTGDNTISSDSLVIAAAINAGTGIVTLRQAGTTSRPISLGGGTAAGALGISDTELGQVTASQLRIGRTDNIGDITVDGAVTHTPAIPCWRCAPAATSSTAPPPSRRTSPSQPCR